jgi:hypothetical protein
MEKSTATYAGFGQGYAHRPGKRPRGAGPLVLPDGGAEYTWSRAGPSSSSVSDFHDSGASSEDARLLDDHAHALDGSGDDDYGPDDGLVGQPRPSGVSKKRPRRMPSALDANSLPLEGTSEVLKKLSAQAADDDEPSMPHQEVDVELPRREPAPMDDAQRAANLANNDTAVRELRAFLSHHEYNLTAEESAQLDRRDANGNVDCTLVVNGFPVNSQNPWLNLGGGAIARSMEPHAVQLGACGLLDSFCRIDIFPGARHYREGRNLDQSVMNKTAKCAMRTCQHFDPRTPLQPQPTATPPPHLRHRLLHAISFSGEVLVFGALAIRALRRTARVIEEVGLDYGLVEPRHAFTTQHGVYVHPPSLPPSPDPVHTRLTRAACNCVGRRLLPHLSPPAKRAAELGGRRRLARRRRRVGPVRREMAGARAPRAPAPQRHRHG